MSAVVIGIGNPHRRDDGVGPAVASRVSAHGLAGVEVHTCPAEPTALLDAWDGAALAVLIDAAVGGVPGRVRRCAPTDLADAKAVSSHDLNLSAAYELACALGRAPQSVVVIAVDVADTAHGEGLTPAVAAALGEAERAVLGVLRQAQEGADQSP